MNLDHAVLPEADPERVGVVFDELEFGAQLRGRLLEAANLPDHEVFWLVSTLPDAN